METTYPKRIRIGYWCKRALKWFCCAVLAYLAILLVGLIPVNNDFEPAVDGITLYIVSNAVHADIIVPKRIGTRDWTEKFEPGTFESDISNETHVAFGWGDRGFFLKTETWDDFELSVAANALFVPSQSCVHVSFTRPEYYSDATSVTISEKQYESLVEYIDEMFKRDADGQFKQIIDYAYSTNDAFFEANGHYHFLNTCNSWVGRALKAAGVRVPLLSPMPKSPMLYIDSGASELPGQKVDGEKRGKR